MGKTSMFRAKHRPSDEHRDNSYAMLRRAPINLYRGRSREFHMGSAIVPRVGPYPCLLGVVGPFVKGVDDHFFLTANHVISQGLKYTNNDKTRVLQLTFKPDEFHEASECGRTVAGGTFGRVAALVQIKEDFMERANDFLKSGRFPFAGISSVNFPSYDNRDVQGITEVFVFGKQTRTAKAQVIYDERNGWIHLKALENSLLKPQEGGAAVFVMDNYNILHCMGIYVCVFEHDIRRFLVVPIDTILQQLGMELGQTLKIVSFNNRVSEHVLISENNVQSISGDRTMYHI